MRRLAIATSDAFVLVYSHDNPESFREVTELRELILSERDTEDVPIVVVANKADCETKTHSCSRLEDIQTESAIANVDWNTGFVAASAKKGINVVAIFAELLRQLAKEKVDLSDVLMKRWLSLSELQNKSQAGLLKPKRRSLFGRKKLNKN